MPEIYEIAQAFLLVIKIKKYDYKEVLLLSNQQHLFILKTVENIKYY